MRQFLLLAGVGFASTALLSAADADVRLFQAIRSGDVASLKQALTKSNLESRDRRGATLLMHSAAFGNLATLKLLLDMGADANARNDFNATALLWAARDPEKARVLIAHGADVNARSKQGRTPLMLAALRPGGSAIVALLLSKGADPSVADNHGDTALGLAATIGEAESMRLLLAKGADPMAKNDKGETSLILASKGRSAAAIRLLLDRHVDVNAANTFFNTVRNGPIAMTNLTALHRAAAFGPTEAVADLLAAGANVNARDGRLLTPLHFAVATEYPNPNIVRMLIKAGADVNARDDARETPLDWAGKFGYPEVIAILKKADAQGGVPYEPPARPAGEPPTPRAALTRSAALLESSSTTFFKNSGCVGCHHQPLIARAQQVAKSAGIAVNETGAREQLAQLRGQWLSSQEEFLQSINPGGGPNRLAENLLGLAGAGYPPDAITDSAIVDLAEAQGENGAWDRGEEQPRPPITESSIAGTARAIGALQVYAIPARKAEFDARIARARTWLLQAKSTSTDDAAMRLLGLAWAGASKNELAKPAREVLDLQKKEGGWAGNPYLASDAFSTGEAMVALLQSRTATRDEDSVRRGLDFLLSTQYPDGSWYVRSRSIKFQPYFESGFPFGHDQWISAGATAWAAQALALTLVPATATAIP
jgi:ankyrin repeat protein